MFHAALQTIRQAYSGDAAKDQVAIISRLHRIQASPGLRAAAQVVFDQLQAWGLTPEYLRVPATADTRFWGWSLFQEWEATQGTLHLLGPSARKLADYRAVPLSLIPRSMPFQGTLEVVAIDGGDQEADYAGLDVRGRMVLTNVMPMHARRLAVQRFGAAGLIYDGMSQAPPVRLACDLPDALQYTSFWWWDNETPDTFGFTVSQKVGAWLRDLLRHSREPLQVQVDIQSRFFDGTLDGVTVRIPGATDDEVVVVSHLCHPAPCANDNASGVGCALELARTLHTLIAQGQLAPPQRGIRFLWVAEMTGSYAYLATPPTWRPTKTSWPTCSPASTSTWSARTRRSAAVFCCWNGRQPPAPVSSTPCWSVFMLPWRMTARVTAGRAPMPCTATPACRSTAAATTTFSLTQRWAYRCRC